MDITLDESYFSAEREVGVFRLHDEGARVSFDGKSICIAPSNAVNCVLSSSVSLGLIGHPEEHAINIVSDPGLGVLTPDIGLPAMLSDTRHLGLGIGATGNVSECFLDVHGAIDPQTEKPQFVASPGQVIDYGIVRANEGFSLSLSKTGMNLFLDQNILIKNNLIYADPINYLQTDSPLSLHLDEGRYVRADLTRVQAILTDDTNASMLGLIDTNIRGMNWDNMSQGFFGSDLDTFRIQDQFVGLSNSYNETLVSATPSNLLSLTTHNYLADTSFLAVSATSLEEDRTQVVQRYYDLEEHDEVSHLLKDVDPGFVKMYEGATEVLYSGNPDKVRHFSVSFRELFTHIMHRAAPNDEIKAWSSEESLFHNGKPTRKARLKYITRNLDSPKFEKYLYAVIEATGEFLDLFQRGAHAVDSGYTESQLDVMKIQADATIRLLLSASEAI